MGFFEYYFIRPVIEHTGYNIVNTTTYALVLIASIFLIYKITVKLKISLDKELWINLVPFVFLGGILRALSDISFFSVLGPYHALFVTPSLYIIVFLLAFASIIISKLLWRDFIRYFGLLSVIISISFVLLNIKNIFPLSIVIFIAAISYVIIYKSLKYLKIDILNRIQSYNSYVLGAHLLDASTAFVAVSVIGGYQESGIFTSFLFSQMPGWFFIPLKAILILIVLHFLDKENDEKTKWILKFAIFVLGLGPGLHNLFSIILGSNMVM